MRTPSAVTTVIVMSEMSHIGWNPLAQTGRTIARTTAPSASLYRMLRELNQSPIGQGYPRACSPRDPRALVIAGPTLDHVGRIEPFSVRADRSLGRPNVPRGEPPPHKITRDGHAAAAEADLAVFPPEKEPVKMRKPTPTVQKTGRSDGAGGSAVTASPIRGRYRGISAHYRYGRRHAADRSCTHPPPPRSPRRIIGSRAS